MAAEQVAAHADTPLTVQVDGRGLVVRGEADAGPEGRLETTHRYDGLGRHVATVDPRGNTAIRHRYDLADRPLWTESGDGGWTLALPRVTSDPFRSWTERGFEFRTVYDDAARPVRTTVVDDGEESLRSFTLYREQVAGAEARNLRGVPVLVVDDAGLVETKALDFEGNVLASSRRLVDPAASGDSSGRSSDGSPWPVFPPDIDENTLRAQLEVNLEPAEEAFETSSTWDALGRPTSSTAPDGSVQRFEYDPGGALYSVTLQPPDSNAVETLVAETKYNARGQQTRVLRGNGVETVSEYDPDNFRLKRIRSVRQRDGRVLQDQRYTYDAAGNTIHVTDGAQQAVFFNNAVVEPDRHFVYDALHRLRGASGREHAQVPMGPREHTLPPRGTIPSDLQALRRYTRRYEYDDAGNIATLRHVVPGGTGSWVREYAYEPQCNRLLATSYPSDPNDPAQWSAQYSYDAAGNMLALPHVPGMKWDAAERLVAAELGGGGTATYTYDGGGQRVRKRVERSASEVVERVYVGGFERYRRTRNGQLVEASITKHIAGSIVETWTHRNGSELSEPERIVRYQLSDRVGSSTIETDDAGNVISLEEYFPFGQTAYSAASGVAETSLKRYRFAGKERDEETGLYYIGARYYAAWQARMIQKSSYCGRHLLAIYGLSAASAALT